MRRRPTVVVLSVLLYSVPGGAQSYTITTVAGTNFVGDGGKAVNAQLSAVEGLATDAAGNLYIADNTDHRVRKVSPNGLISTVAGNGNPGFSGDGGLAVNASLNAPYGIAIDKDGRLLIADYGNARIRCVTPDGLIKTIAGGGQSRSLPGDGSDALGAQFVGPRNVAIDPIGSIYVSDYADHRVYRITSAGRISVVAGTGTGGFNGDGAALSARLNFPAGLAVDRSGVVYIADSGNRTIRKLAAGTLATVAGGASGTIELAGPTGLSIDGSGVLYIADSLQNRVYRRTAAGLFTTLAGIDPVLAGPTRDVTVDVFGNVFAADGRRVLRVSSVGPPAVVAGDGTFAGAPDNTDATMSYLNSPINVSLDGTGNLLIVEERGKRVRRVAQGLIKTVAGGGSGTSLGDGGPAVAAQLADPVAVASDGFGGLRIADYQGNRIRGVTPAGTIYTVAGDGEPGYGGDNQPATASRLNRPRGVATDRDGNLYIADSLNHRIRRVGVNGFTTTVAGSGVRGYFGDGGAATEAHLNAPLGVAVDAVGNLYIADSGNHAIRRVTPFGVISTVAGTGGRGFAGDGGPATLALFNYPSSVAADSSGALFIADTFNQRLRRVGADGTVTTVAGDGTEGFAGDGGPATSARLRNPTGVAVDGSGNIYIADLDNNRVRRLALAALPPPAVEQLPEAVLMNAASFRSGPVAPGQIVSVFGDGIGPEAGASGRMNAIGALDTNVEETQVRFDGRPAPLLYVRQDQVTLQVPYSLAGQSSSEVQVFYRGKLRSRMTVPVARTAPGIFTQQRGVGQAVVVNPDGTINSTTNPAARGSLVAIYATGEGQTNPGGRDGTPAPGALARPVLPVSVQVGTADAEIVSAGSAPGCVGLFQLVVRLPGAFTPPGVRSLTVTVGGVPSQPGVTIAVQ